jgi:hypothetical protein
MPDPAQLKLLRIPQGDPSQKLPPTTKAGPLDLALAGLGGLLGIGPSLDDPSQYDLSQDDKNSMTRAQALGEALGMGGPSLGMMLKLPKGVSRGNKMVQGILNSSLVENRTTPEVKGMAQWLVDKFPRLATHVSTISGHPDMPGVGMMEAPYKADADGLFSSLNFNPATVDNKFDQTAAMGHEAAHTAQALRRTVPDPDAGGFDLSRYHHVGKAYERQFGYPRSPFEVRAETAGINQANRQMMQERGSGAQPLLPEVGKNKYIKSWSEAAARDIPSRAKHTYGMMVKPEPIADAAQTAAKWELPEKIVQEAKEAQEYWRQGRLGNGEVQRQLPLEPNYSEKFLREFAPMEEPAATRPTFKQPTPPDARQMNANAKPPAYSRGFAPDEGMEFDISNLAQTMGVGKPNVRGGGPVITLIGGEKPRVRIQRMKQGGHGGVKEVEEYEVPAGMADMLRKKSFDLGRGR